MQNNLSGISSCDCVSRQDITSTGGDAEESLAPRCHPVSISVASKQRRGLPRAIDDVSVKTSCQESMTSVS